MSEDIHSIISHVSLGTRDIARALVFYDAVMVTIGASRKAEIKPDNKTLTAVAYGKQVPEFWIQVPANDRPAEIGNGIHVGFMASNRQSVVEFHKVALSKGGTDEGAPGPRPHYGEAYYGCFISDLDGNRIEAVFLDFSLLHS